MKYPHELILESIGFEKVESKKGETWALFVRDNLTYIVAITLPYALRQSFTAEAYSDCNMTIGEERNIGKYEKLYKGKNIFDNAEFAANVITKIGIAKRIEQYK